MRQQHFNTGKTTLTSDQLRAVAPSVFAERPYHAVSERYRFIPTSAVLDRLMSNGWEVKQAMEQRVRLVDKRGFTKHRVVLEQAGAKPINKIGDAMPRILLTNSHDRGSSYIVEAGLFRMVCANGLIVSDGDFGKIRVQHSGAADIADRVLEGTYTVVNDMQQIVARAEELQGVSLNRDEQMAYAEAALALRWDGAAPVTAEQLLLTRRREDQEGNLWTTYNKVQENIIRGGLHGVKANGARQRTRGVNSINEDTRINRALWQLAEKMAELKAA